MKFSRQIIGLAAVSLVACGLSVVGSDPGPVADAGGSSSTSPTGTVEPLIDAGDTPDAADGGPHGVALAFDGLGNFVRAQRNVKDDFTLEAWILTSTSLDGGAFYEGAPILWADISGEKNDFAMSTLKGKLAFGAKNVTVTSTTDVTTGAWFHVAVVRTKAGGSMALFVNGLADGTASGSSNIPLDDSLTLDIGGDILDNRWFKGLIREVRVWNKVRTQAEIVATMSSRLTGYEPGLVSYWRLDDGTGLTAADSADGGKNPGSLGNGDAGTRPTWVTF